MNITPINYQTGMIKNNSITFNGAEKQLVHGATKKIIEKTVLPAGATLAAIAGVKLTTENNTNNNKNEKIQTYLDRMEHMNGDYKILDEILADLSKEPESREKTALWEASIKKLVYNDKTTAKECYDQEMQYYAAKDAAVASLNPDAKIDEEVINAAVAYLQKCSDIKPEKISHVAELMRSNPAIVEKLMSYNNPDGSQMFTPEEVGEFFLNAENGIKNDPGAIFVKIESDFFKEHYQDFSGPSVALWYFLYH